MSTRTLFKLLAIGVVGVLLSAGQASAACTGTSITPSSEVTSTGTRCGGDSGDTASSNDTREALCEVVSSGNSRLIHTWTFTSVPAGSLKISREGYRLPGCDNDNFKFQVSYDYNDGNGPHFIFGSFCTISSDSEGSLECNLSTTITDTATVKIDLVDTVTTGSKTDLSSVHIDAISVCSE